MKIESLAMELCRNCGHAMHHHENERGACGFCQTKPYCKCSCGEFKFPGKEKVRELPRAEQEKLALAAHLGIDPRIITSIKRDCHLPRPLGAHVKIWVFTGEEYLDWVQRNLPDEVDWVLKYLAHLENQKK